MELHSDFKQKETSTSATIKQSMLKDSDESAAYDIIDDAKKQHDDVKMTTNPAYGDSSASAVSMTDNPAYTSSNW